MMKPYIYLTLYFIFATIANCYAIEADAFIKHISLNLHFPISVK
uniref:Shiga toxin A subunit n=1 Tax=Heterorhabditis bacteriophora TaxID=37862 RepID=A0A1I7WP88_HETBA